MRPWEFTLSTRSNLRQVRRILLLGDLAIEYDDGAVLLCSRREAGAMLAVLLYTPGEWVRGSDVARWLGQSAGYEAKTLMVPVRRSLKPTCGLTQRAGDWRIELGTARRDVDECDGFLEDAERAIAQGRPADAVSSAMAVLTLFRGSPLSGLTATFDQLRDIVEALESRRDRACAVLTIAEKAGVADRRTAAALAASHARNRSDRVTELIAQLPIPGMGSTPMLPDSSEIVGRDDLIERILGQIAAADELQIGRIVVQISGRSGIGKSTLLRALADRLATNHVGRIVELDLRGTSRPLDPHLAMARAIRPFRHDAAPPVGQAAAYRSLFAAQRSGRRTLVLLDHAEDAQHVRPLLPPPDARTIVLVASVRALSPLDEHAVETELRPLDIDAAHDLVARAAGRPLRPMERREAATFIQACGALPLCLAITGSKVALGETTFATAVDALRDLNIDFFDDTQHDLRWFLGFAIRGASLDEQSTLAAVGWWPVPYLDVDIVAAALDCDTDAARAALVGLADRRLFDSRPGGRWSVHSVVRGFARHYEVDGCDRAAALARALDSMTTTADRLGATVNPARLRPFPAVARADAVGMSWFDERRDLLVAMVELAHHAREWNRCWQLAAVVDPLLAWRLGGPDRTQVLDIAEDAAAHGDDVVVRKGWCLMWRAEMLRYDGQYAKAFATAARARRMLVQAGESDAAAAAQVLCGDLRTGYRMAGESPADHLADALRMTRQGAQDFAELGHVAGQAVAAEGVGEILALQGDFDAALAELDRCYTLYRSLGDERGMAQVRRLQAATRHLTGEYEEAAFDAEAAISIARSCDEAAEAARAQVTLGRIRQSCGDLAAALTVLQAARDYFESVHDQRWLLTSTCHLAEVLRSVDRSDPGWRRQARRAQELAQSLGDEHYRQLAERLLDIS